MSLRLLSSSTTQITDIRACTRTRTYSVLSVVSLSRSRSHLFSILFHASIDPYCIDCNVPWEQFAKKDSERESKRLSFAGCFEKKVQVSILFFFPFYVPLLSLLFPSLPTYFSRRLHFSVRNPLTISQNQNEISKKISLSSLKYSSLEQVCNPSTKPVHSEPGSIQLLLLPP